MIKVHDLVQGNPLRRQTLARLNELPEVPLDPAMKILIAEDDPLIRRLLKAILERLGHEVVEAANGDEAWEIYKREPTRMVLTDWDLPGKSGVELCQLIRFQESNSSYTYIVLLTGHEERGRIAIGLAAGADDFINKPFDVLELRWRVNSGMRVLQLEDALERQINELSVTSGKLSESNARLSSELQAAAEAQRALLPRRVPAEPHIASSWVFEPCNELGGDGLNLFSIDEDHVGFYVLDVCGHGVKSALLAVTLSRILSQDPNDRLLSRSSGPSRPTAIASPAQVLERLNEMFPMDEELGIYFTALYGVMNIRTGNVRYASAGHPGPLIVSRDGTVTEFKEAGPPVGFFDDPEFETVEVNFSAGDRLILFTDGIVESRAPDGEMFGMERLKQAVRERRTGTTDELVEHLRQVVKQFRGGQGADDDCSLIVLDYCGSAGQPGDVACPLDATSASASQNSILPAQTEA